MTSFLRILTTVAVLALLLPSLRAEESAFALPDGSPLATLALPDGLQLGNVSVAVSKALCEAEWNGLGWEGNVTTANLTKSHIAIKVFAVAAASEVKFYARCIAENGATEEKCRQVATRELRNLGALTAEKLHLTFKKARGTETVDRAVAD